MDKPPENIIACDVMIFNKLNYNREARTMAKQQEALVLVGFGKSDLVDMIHKINTPEERDLFTAPTNSPPRWRREAICTDKEIEAFVLYTRWVSTKLMSTQGEK
jgi:hypothetical protein